MDVFLVVTVRALVVVIAILVAAATLGATYQRLSEIADLKRYRPPGTLIDVGQRRLHLLCAGSASRPTVVIEAGAGNDSTLWEGMVRRVSAFAHVCTYDRAGLGWSDPPAGSRTINDRAAELKALLTAAEVPPPFVLIGHSYGGFIVRRFASAFPADVAGVVLIEAPDEAFAYAPEGFRDGVDIGGKERRLGWLVRSGLARLGIQLFPDRYDPVRGVPAEVHGLMSALFLRAARHFETADEMASYAKVPMSWRTDHGFGTLGSIPLAVVSRGLDAYPEWQDAQRRLANLSTVSTHVVAEHSGHMIQFSEPRVIEDAIRRVLDEASKAGRH